MKSRNSFAVALDKAIEESGMTAAALARKTGISPAMISQYRNSVSLPSEEYRERIEAVLKMRDDAEFEELEIPRGEPLKVEEAARMMGESEGFVRLSLLQDKWPSCVGYAVAFEKSYRYHINRECFIKWLNGEIVEPKERSK